MALDATNFVTTAVDVRLQLHSSGGTDQACTWKKSTCYKNKFPESLS